jgi:hypothetical protein
MVLHIISARFADSHLKFEAPLKTLEFAMACFPIIFSIYPPIVGIAELQKLSDEAASDVAVRSDRAEG